MFLEAADSNPAAFSEAESETVRHLLKLQDTARSALFKARTSRAMKAIQSQKIRAEPRVYVLGEAVFYRRPLKMGTHKDKWCGPGIISSVVASQDPESSALSYGVNHGGVEYRVAKGDLKGVLGRNEEPLVIEGANEVQPVRVADGAEDEERKALRGLRSESDQKEVERKVTEALKAENAKQRKAGRPKGSTA